MTGFRDPDRKVRVGAVSYLNTRPLIYRFAYFAPDAELVLDVPSRLAVLLSAGELDVALLPSIEGFRGHVLFPGGLILEESGEVKIYYGAADTVECLATAHVDDLLALCN